MSLAVAKNESALISLTSVIADSLYF